VSRTAEFSKPVKRLALERAGKRCEAVGALYGLPEGQRCGADLGYGVQFDHVVLEANSKDNSLENCAAVCPRCHGWKTAKHDTPLAAKTVRQRDKALGIRKSSTFRKPPTGYGFDWRRGRYTKLNNKGL
jgi:5-methylcytosine-specific restriction endonuclease McrA